MFIRKLFEFAPAPPYVRFDFLAMAISTILNLPLFNLGGRRGIKSDTDNSAGKGVTPFNKDDTWKLSG
jgi:hypothetical protein